MALKSDLVLPADGIKIKLSNVKAYVGEKDYGTGTLCISESDLIWRMEDGKGMSFNYPQIALHAISSDLAAFPQECLYMIVDKSALEDSNEEDQDNEENSDDSDEISPIRFVPEDKTFLQPMFRAINECQALHPDPEDDNSENEDEEDGGEEGEGEDENDFRDDEDESVQRIEELESEFDPDSVQLSARGRQIWERLNAASVRHQNDSNEGDNNNPTEQFEDADDISQQ